MKDFKIFGGDATNLGVVHALLPTTFKDLVGQLINVAIPIPLSREDYQKLPPSERASAKRAPYIVPCTFAESPSRRLHELATGIAVLCLDVDDPDQARPLVNHTDMLADQLAPFAFAVHHTASSTPEKPRVRVLVEADLPLSCYAEAVQDIGRRLGLVSVTRESLVAVQPMFRPVLFRGETKSPLITAMLDPLERRAYTEQDLPELRDPVSGDVIRAAHKTQSTAPDGDEAFAALEYLRSPVSEIGLADVTSALKMLDPDCSYPLWLEIAAALRHQFPMEESEAAYVLFDDWSSKGQKYKGPEDTRAKWDSLIPNPAKRVPVTIRTLLARAVEAGWDGNKVKARCYKATRSWIKDTKLADPSELLFRGRAMIAATPLLSLSEEEGLLQELAAALREAGMKTTVATLRKDLHRMKAQEKQKKKGKAIPDWAKGMVFIAHPAQFFRPATGEELSPDALDANYGMQLMPSEDEIKDSGGELSACRPAVRPQDFLLNGVQIPRAYDKLYMPRQGGEVFGMHEGKVFVNTYARTYPEPDLLRMDEAGEAMEKHMRNLLDNPEHRKLLLDFMAFQVQYPGEKIRWATILQGAPGCGKTLLADVMRAVLGSRNVNVVDRDAICGGWSEWAYGFQLVVMEEIRVAGRNRHDVMNKIKPLITNDVTGINERFKGSRATENCTNYMLFTNHHDALVLTEEDRRYFVLKSRLQDMRDVIALGPDYFAAIYKQIQDNASGLRAWFERYKIGPEFNPNSHAPRTTFFDEMAIDSVGETCMAMRTAIADSANPLVQPDLLSSTALATLMGNAGQYCGVQQLAKLLREDGWVRAGRYTIDEARHQLWVRAGGKVLAANAYGTAVERVRNEGL